jgi:hypothetical protein
MRKDCDRGILKLAVLLYHYKKSSLHLLTTIFETPEAFGGVRHIYKFPYKRSLCSEISAVSRPSQAGLEFCEAWAWRSPAQAGPGTSLLITAWPQETRGNRTKSLTSSHSREWFWLWSEGTFYLLPDPCRALNSMVWSYGPNRVVGTWWCCGDAVRWFSRPRPHKRSIALVCIYMLLSQPQ